MPASELLLALFVANCAARSLSSLTVDKCIVGIHKGHQITDAPWYSAHLLSQAKKGARKLISVASWLGKNWPITLRH